MPMDILLASLEALATKSETNSDPVIKSDAYFMIQEAFTNTFSHWHTVTGSTVVIQPKQYVYGVKMILERLGVPYTERNEHPLKYPSKTLITIDFTLKNN